MYIIQRPWQNIMLFIYTFVSPSVAVILRRVWIFPSCITCTLMCHRWRPKGFIIWVYTPNVASLAHGMTVGTRYLSRQKQWPCYQHTAARSFSHLVAFVHIPAMTCRIQRVILIGNEVFSSQSIYQRIITIYQAVAKNKAKGNNITRKVSGTPLSYVS